jgi:aspartyl/glutamyl-tRNA(Asn/Gln) amidotransferase C subunit
MQICAIIDTYMANSFTTSDVKHIASLANIPVTDAEAEKLSKEFSDTLIVVEEVNAVDVSNVSAVHMTGLSNVLREDVVDTERMFTQEEALSNAPETHNGFFVVNQVIDQGES